LFSKFYILPLFYLVTTGRLDTNWQFHKTHDPLINSICFANYITIFPAIWIQYGWHTIIAFVLYSFIVRRQPLPNLHRWLKPGFLIVMVFTAIKMTFELLGIFYKPMELSQYYSSLILISVVPIYVGFIYGNTLYVLARGGPAMTPATRTIRDRLLAMSSYLVVVAVIRGITLSFGLGGNIPPMTMIVVTNSSFTLWGFMDR